MEHTEKRKQKNLWLLIGAYAAVALLLLLVTNLSPFNQWIGSLLRIFRPALIGLAIAYLCNPFFRFFERKLFSKIRPFSLRRAISLIFTYLVLFLIVGILLLLIVPQLLDSILSFASNAEAYVDRTVGEVNNLIASLNNTLTDGEGGIPPIDPTWLKATVANFFADLQFKTEWWQDILNAETILTLFSLVENLFTIVTDIILGLFISLYLLQTKEKRYAQIMRLRRAVFSEKVNAVLTKICSTADRSFGGFIRGKLLDSAMVGVLVYLAISLLGVPYAILIAVIVAITDIIPVIGPFIGVFPSAVIILLTDPSKVIPFLLCILIVQQIDGNILAPKILGENTGVSSLCVMIAITTMGALWGLVGMVLGVPLFATVLELTSDYLDKRLQEKGLPNDTESYYDNLPATPEKEHGGFFGRRQRKKELRLREESIGGGGILSEFERRSLNGYRLMQKYRALEECPAALPQGLAEEGEQLFFPKAASAETAAPAPQPDNSTPAEQPEPPKALPENQDP